MSGLEYIDIPFGPYLPDLGGAPNPDMPGYLVDAVGVRPTPNGYRGMPVFQNVTSATQVTSSAAIQAFGLQNVDAAAGNSMFVVTSSGTIYESTDNGVTWNDETGAVTLNHSGSFFSFGTDVVYVCNNDNPVKKDLTAGVANFVDLGGSPPKAYCGAKVRQHVVLGGLVSDDLTAIRWSAIGDHEDWPTPGSTDALAKQAGRQQMPPELGLVKVILGGEKIGIVAQQGGLTRMTYVGGDVVYDFDTYETGVGAGGNITSQFPECRFVSDGTLWYWPTRKGFFATDGYSVNCLSEGSLQESIFNALISHPDQSNAPQAVASSAIDPFRNMLIFGNLTANKQLVYHLKNRSFTWLNETTFRAIFNGFDDGTTQLQSGRLVYNINDTDGKLQSLSASGSTTTIAMQTGFIEVDPGYRVNLQGAHLIGANGMGSLTLSYKAAADFTSMDVLQTGFTSLTAAPLGMKKTGRAASQFFAFRVTGTGAESQLLRGIRIYYTRDAPSP